MTRLPDESKAKLDGFESATASERKAFLESLPVETRALLAGVALAAAGRSLSGVALARSGQFARGTALRRHSDYFRTINAAAPALVALLLDDDEVETGSVAKLAADLQARDQTITKLRASLSEAEDARDVVLGYARDLHEDLARHRDSEHAARLAKVRHLRPEPDPPEAS